jgi:hypothetical protein
MKKLIEKLKEDLAKRKVSAEKDYADAKHTTQEYVARARLDEINNSLNMIKNG